MYQLRFVHQNFTYHVEAGVTLAQACADAGFALNLVCGGKGTCGKCRVEVAYGDRRELVLACKTPVEQDLSVFLDESQLSRRAAIMTDGYSSHKSVLSPSITKQVRTRQELTPTHCGAYLQGGQVAALRQFSRLISDRTVDALTFVCYKDTLVAVERGDTTSQLYGGAIDIGTTSVVLYAYDLNTGSLLHTESTLNRQITRGADVISRIQHADQEPGGLEELAGQIRQTINDLLSKTEETHPGFCNSLYHLVVCGNSTMQHLFLGLNPSGLSADPFSNVTADPVSVSGDNVGLNMACGGMVDFLPLLGGFVGADTTSVLLTLPVDEGLCLMVDLGTNGEIAVGGGKGYRVASTACGPALEGGNISCGMRGTDGAIEKIKISATGEIALQVIGGSTPKGLCGSAIIDAVSELLRIGVIDPTGRLLTPQEYEDAYPGSPFTCRIKPVGEYNPAFFFTEGEQPVYLSQQDVRQIQLAKSSIHSGCVTLVEAAGLTLEGLDSLYLAGAFGNYIDIDHALQIGLLPPVPRERIHAIGNGAGQGVKLCLLDKGQLERCCKLPNLVEHLELATSPRFMDEYIMNMNF